MAFTVIGLSLVVLALVLALIRERRRLRPLEDLVEAMEKVDLSSPRPLLPASIDGVALPAAPGPRTREAQEAFAAARDAELAAGS